MELQERVLRKACHLRWCTRPTLQEASKVSSALRPILKSPELMWAPLASARADSLFAQRADCLCMRIDTEECTQDHWGCCERHPNFVSVRISALGLFTGAWVREAVGRELANIPWLSKDSGLAAFQLTTSATSTEGLHDVEVASCVTFHHLACDFEECVFGADLINQKALVLTGL